MITLAATVLFFKKIGLFFKNYGLLLLLAVGLVYAFLVARKNQTLYNKLLGEMQGQIQRHHEEVDALQKIHNDEVKRYAEIEKNYNETITRIQQQHQQALEQLDKQKKQELRQIIASTHENPAEMARRVNDLFGLPILGN